MKEENNSYYLVTAAGQVVKGTIGSVQDRQNTLQMVPSGADGAMQWKFLDNRPGGLYNSFHPDTPVVFGKGFEDRMEIMEYVPADKVERDRAHLRDAYIYFDKKEHPCIRCRIDGVQQMSQKLLPHDSELCRRAVASFDKLPGGNVHALAEMMARRYYRNELDLCLNETQSRGFRR